MLDLRLASAADLSEVASWICSPSKCREWAGPGVSFPIEEDELARQIEWPTAHSFSLYSNGELVGFGQIVPKPEKRLHFARFIVKPSSRAKGYGRALTEAILNKALERQTSTVSLNVFRANKPAVALYRNVGFVPSSGESGGKMPEIQYMVYKT